MLIKYSVQLVLNAWMFVENAINYRNKRWGNIKTQIHGKRDGDYNFYNFWKENGSWSLKCLIFDE